MTNLIEDKAEEGLSHLIPRPIVIIYPFYWGFIDLAAAPLYLIMTNLIEGKA